MTNIFLNLKQVRFKHIVDDIENEKVSITVSGSEVFKAGDIGKQLTGFEILILIWLFAAWIRPQVSRLN